jgi:predicted DNA-binding transcriptional regulator AlpA
MQSQADSIDVASHMKPIGVSGLREIDELWTPKQVAEHFDLSVATLQRQRTEGTGLKFIKLGKRRVAYRALDVQAWVERRVAQSTADARVRGLTG